MEPQSVTRTLTTTLSVPGLQDRHLPNTGVLSGLGLHQTAFSAQPMLKGRDELIEALKDYYGKEPPCTRQVVVFRGKEAKHKYNDAKENAQRKAKSGNAQMSKVKLAFYKIARSTSPKRKLEKTLLRVALNIVGQNVADNVDPAKATSQDRHIQGLLKLAEDREIRHQEKFNRPLLKVVGQGIKNFLKDLLRDNLPFPLNELVPENIESDKISPIDIYKEEFKAAKALIDDGFDNINELIETEIEHLEKTIQKLEDLLKSEQPHLQTISVNKNKASENIKILRAEAKKIQDSQKAKDKKAYQSIQALIQNELMAIKRFDDLANASNQIKECEQRIQYLKGKHYKISPEVHEQHKQELGRLKAEYNQAKAKYDKENAETLEEEGIINKNPQLGLLKAGNTTISLKLAERNRDNINLRNFCVELKRKIDEMTSAIVAEKAQIEADQALDPYAKEKQKYLDAQKHFNAQRLFVLRKEKKGADKKYRSDIGNAKEYIGAGAQLSGVSRSLPEKMRGAKSITDKLRMGKKAGESAEKLRDLGKKIGASNKGQSAMGGMQYAEMGAFAGIAVLDVGLNAAEAARHIDKVKHAERVEKRVALFQKAQSGQKISKQEMRELPKRFKKENVFFDSRLTAHAMRLAPDEDYKLVISQYEKESKRARNIFKAAANVFSATTSALHLSATGCLIAGVAVAAFPPALAVMGSVMAGAMIGYSVAKLGRIVDRSDHLKAAEKELDRVRERHQKLDAKVADGKIQKDGPIYKEIKAQLDRRVMACHEVFMKYDHDYRVSVLYDKLMHEEGSVSLDAEKTRPTAVFLQYMGVPEESIQAVIDASNPRAAIDLLKLELGYKVKKHRQRDINPDNYKPEV